MADCAKRVVTTFGICSSIKEVVGTSSNETNAQNVPQETVPLPGITPMLQRSHAIAGAYTTPYVAGDDQVLGTGSASSAKLRNKDVQLNITCGAWERYNSILSVASSLESEEFHCLKIEDKLVVFGVLIECCHDTGRIREVLAQHADERTQRLITISKQLEDAKVLVKDARFRIRDYNDEERQFAHNVCRLYNIESASITNLTNQKLKEADEAASQSKKKGSKQKQTVEDPVTSSSKNDGDANEVVIEGVDIIDGMQTLVAALTTSVNSKADSAKEKAALAKGNVNESKEKGSSAKEKSNVDKDKDAYTPNAAQMVQYLEDSMLLQKAGVDICITSPATLLYKAHGMMLPVCYNGKLGKVNNNAVSGGANKKSVVGSGSSRNRGSSRRVEVDEDSEDETPDEDIFLDECGLPIEAPPSDDEGEEDSMAGDLGIGSEELLDMLDAKQKSQLRHKSAVRAAVVKDKLRRRNEYENLVQMRRDANYYLNKAVESRNDKEIRSAVKYAKQCGLEGIVPGTSLTYCSSTILKV